MKTIAVIGSNSFSGSHFIDLLLSQTEFKVVGISRSPEKSSLFLPYKKNPHLSRFSFFQFDLNKNIDALLSLLDREKPEGIVNFAAQGEVTPSWEHPEHWFQTNCCSLAVLINHLRKKDYLKRYLQISSPEVYGSCKEKIDESAPLNPSTPYAASKAAADLLLFTYYKQFSFPAIFVRSTNVYGPGQQLYKIIPKTVISLKLGKKIELHGGGKAIKSYIHIRDVSEGELAILKSGKVGEIYHLSPDEGIAVCDVVRKICQKLGKNFDKSVTTVAERPGQDAAYVIDSTKARKNLNWTPKITFDDGLEEVMSWIEQNWEELRKQPLEYLHRP